MLESLNEIKRSLKLLNDMYLSIANKDPYNQESLLLLLRCAIDGIEDEIFLIDNMIHGSIEDKEEAEQ